MQSFSVLALPSHTFDCPFLFLSCREPSRHQNCSCAVHAQSGSSIEVDACKLPARRQICIAVFLDVAHEEKESGERVFSWHVRPDRSCLQGAPLYSSVLPPALVAQGFRSSRKSNVAILD